MNIQTIDAILPQTQCTRCGYPDCLAYAKAIAEGAPHNQCPPGGMRVIAELSALLNRPALPLNPANGIEAPKVIALIHEDECIGCTKCIQACPVDAIVGTAKHMHTVLSHECTGCMLCVEPCPVDCISLLEAPKNRQPELMPSRDRTQESDHYRQRHYSRIKRLERLKDEKQSKHQALKSAKEAYIAQALERAKAKRK